MAETAGIGADMRPLFIFEMANNHQGSVEHGKKIIRELKEVCREFEADFDFAVKFQFRELDTFIHPAYKEREDIKNVKRFMDTRLSMEQFQKLYDEVKACGFKAICTPFDEPSVDRIVEMQFDYLKIASCSATDWPLLEKVAQAGKPVIASAAGTDMEDLKRLVAFFEHRKIELSLMHCVAEYPTMAAGLQMNQIDLYKNLFPGHIIGFSTHEEPDNMEPVKLAVAKGAGIFEKHVGVPTDTITLNGYSANPAQVRGWLEAAREAYIMCGVLGERYPSSDKEQSDLAALQRGVFVKYTQTGEKEITAKDVYLAFPCQPGQLLARDLSKYSHILLKENVTIKEDAPIMLEDVIITNKSSQIKEIIKRVLNLIEEGNVVIPANSSCELSHHYGIDGFYQTGVTMIDCINREYCKKILVVLPGQSNPFHYHKQKEETFLVLHGELQITCDGITEIIHKGETKTIERGVNHSFSSANGCVFEEISTTHYPNDSFYENQRAFVTPRKTEIYLTKSLLEDE